jgi:hypothetical protein
LNPWVQILFFHQAAGFPVPQYGHFFSEVLISFLQLGQSRDCLF